MKILIVLFSALLLCVLSSSAFSESTPIINLISDPDAQYSFKDEAVILEVVFPRVFSSDCTIIRFGEETILVDASTDSPDMHERIRAAVELMNIDHFDIAYNSHPHRDHILGFPIIYEYAPFEKFYVTFPDDADFNQKKIMKFMREHDVPTELLNHGDHLTLLADNAPVISVIQHRDNTYWPLNDRSAMLHISYGDRTILLTGDNETRAQKFFCENPPYVSLKSDIMKYPHHGHAPLTKEFRAAVDPKLCILTGSVGALDQSTAYLQKQEIPYLLAYKGITRMRTDGSIWVIDYLE